MRPNAARAGGAYDVRITRPPRRPWWTLWEARPAIRSGDAALAPTCWAWGKGRTHTSHDKPCAATEELRGLRASPWHGQPNRRLHTTGLVVGWDTRRVLDGLSQGRSYKQDVPSPSQRRLYATGDRVVAVPTATPVCRSAYGDDQDGKGRTLPGRVEMLFQHTQVRTAFVFGIRGRPWRGGARS